MSEIRLQKYISQCGIASRRQAEELILEGKVKVNNQTVTTLGTKVDPSKDTVQVRKKILRPEEKGIILFHKPKNVIATMSDPEGRPTVADYLTKHFKSYAPAGRLDWDTTGLMVLTNDGELSQRLTHPKFKVPRTYELKVSGQITEKTLARIERGIVVDGRKVEAKLEFLRENDDSSWLTITISEGRNHIVKKLFEIVHHPVQKLKRISHGPFRLGKLRVGEIRKLTEIEYHNYRKKLFA